eukprot:1564650-Rhodomonas_salina.1
MLEPGRARVGSESAEDRARCIVDSEPQSMRRKLLSDVLRPERRFRLACNMQLAERSKRKERRGRLRCREDRKEQGAGGKGARGGEREEGSKRGPG